MKEEYKINEKEAEQAKEILDAVKPWNPLFGSIQGDKVYFILDIGVQLASNVMTKSGIQYFYFVFLSFLKIFKYILKGEVYSRAEYIKKCLLHILQN